MQSHSSTTPFGRRSLTLAHVATQATAKARPPDKAVHKWQVFRAICTAKARIGVSERALAVLDALLSFHPETTLSGEGLIVFPSNQQLALRAHGMAPATLRRHLAALVDCGLVIRRDSPNGKRFARKGRGGTIEMAFGFELSPLVARAEEFEAWAEDVRGGGAGVAIGPRAHHALPARHRQDDRDGNRGGRPDPQGRAGAFRLGGDPRALSRHPGADSAHGDAGGTRADRRRSDAAGRRNPQPVGKSRKIIKFERQ